jgi:hypothetical protein
MRALAAVAILLAPTVLATAVAQAQSRDIYRCGPDGRVLQQAPCRDGVAVKTAPAPNAADHAAAMAVAKREAELADRMAHERKQRERADAQSTALAISVGPTPAAPTGASGSKSPKGRKRKAATKKPG